MKFNILYPRFVSAVRDDNRVPGLISADTITGLAEGVTALSLAAGVVIAPTMAIVDSNGNQVTGFSALNLKTFDYVARVLTNSTTETYTFKSGGSGGTTTNTVVIVYTDTTLATISTVTKT